MQSFIKIGVLVFEKNDYKTMTLCNFNKDCVSYNNSLLTLLVGKSRIVVGVQITWHTVNKHTWPIKTTWVMRHVCGVMKKQNKYKRPFMNQKGIITAYCTRNIKAWKNTCIFVSKKSPNPKLKMKLKKKKLLGLGTCKSYNKLLKKMSEADFVLG